MAVSQILSTDYSAYLELHIAFFFFIMVAPSGL